MTMMMIDDEGQDRKTKTPPLVLLGNSNVTVTVRAENDVTVNEPSTQGFCTVVAAFYVWLSS